MTVIYLIRHPPTQGGNIIKGHDNLPLVDGWENDLESLEQKLYFHRPFHAILASDLDRSIVPAMHLLAYFQVVQGKNIDFISTPLLRERNVGHFSGKPFREIPSGGKHPHEYIFEQDNIPGGESKSEVYARIRSVEAQHVQKYHPHGNVISLGHGWFNNYWRNHALGNHSLSYNNMPPLGVLVLELNGKSAREIPFS